MNVKQLHKEKDGLLQVREMEGRAGNDRILSLSLPRQLFEQKASLMAQITGHMKSPK